MIPPKKKQTILVTGGAGFIGSHVVKRLSKLKYNLVVIDNLNKYYDPELKKSRLKIFLKDVGFKFHQTDIADNGQLRRIFAKHKIDLICHLAGQPGVRYSLKNPFIYGQSNVAGTLNLLELAKQYKVKGFIFASSSSIYGNSGEIPFTEAQNTDKPVSIYAATKKASELFAYTYHHLYNINCTGLRFFTVYGPWGRPDMALFSFTQKILKGQTIEVYNYGKLERDFTYVDDIVDGVVSAINKNYPWEIINLSSSRPIKLDKFISVIEDVLQKKAKIKLMPMQKGDVFKTYGNISKAKKLLSYKPKVSFKQGVKNFMEWYRWYYKI